MLPYMYVRISVEFSTQLLKKKNQSYMTLACCSIKVDQGGKLSTRARISSVSWEGGSHAVLFMVPLGHPGVRSMAQGLQLPFEYYTY